MEKQLIQAALAEYAARRMPPRPDLWPAIRARAGQGTPPAQTPPRRSPPQLGRVLWPTTILALLVLGAVALLPLLKQGGIAGALPTPTAPEPTPPPNPTHVELLRGVLQVEPIFDPIYRSIDEKDFTRIGQSQTINGYTASLEIAYANPNLIILGCVVTGPTGQHVLPLNAVLYSANGTRLTLAGGVNSGPGGGDMGQVLAFYTDAIDPLPADLSLHLAFDLSDVTAGDHAPYTAGPGPPPTAVNRGMAPQVAGPFGFGFHVLVSNKGSRIAELNQTVQAGGVSMTLEQVIVTAAETRAILRFNPPTQDRSWSPVATLTAGTWQPNADTLITKEALADGRWSYRFHDTLTQQDGPWTLTISDLVGTNHSGPTLDAQHQPGPWMFMFTVPPVQ